MADTITLTIDDRKVSVPIGTTILQAAEQLGIHIPTICYHPALTANAVCRICVVEVQGGRVLQPACVVQASEGMVVHTRSERVIRSRRTILEMLVSTVNLDEAPEILALFEEYGVDPTRFDGGAKRDFELLDDNPFYVRDYSQCVMCWRCVQVCAEDAQFAFALSYGERGFHSHIATFFDAPMPSTTCVFCGQCVGVCPTGALKPKREWGLEQGMDYDQIREITRKGKRRRDDGSGP
jgi:NADH dehydrogenase/NADH:ubiquinone oxidoreductase subunit G